MRILLQPSFILHYRLYRESSLIVDLLTRDYGRISAVAKGVRTIRSRSRSLLQPFIPLLITWQGKGELMTLSSIEADGPPCKLRGECLLSALYLNEVLMRVLPKQDAHPKLYTIYHETLLELQSDILQEKTLRIFEKKLLAELGYGLQLHYDISDNQPLIADRFYRFYPEQGFKLHVHQDEMNSSWIFSGRSLLALSIERLETTESLQDAKRLMRLALAPLLGPQPLHSRKLFIEVN